MQKKYDIREFRKQLGLTQEKFAELLGVSVVYIGMLENNRKPLTPKIIKRLDEITDKSIDKPIREERHAITDKDLIIASLKGQILVLEKDKEMYYQALIDAGKKHGEEVAELKRQLKAVKRVEADTPILADGAEDAASAS